MASQLVKSPELNYTTLFCHNDLRNSALVPQQPPAVLAKHVLAEIPKQVQEHFNKRGLAPVQSNGPEPPYLGGL